MFEACELLSLTISQSRSQLSRHCLSALAYRHAPFAVQGLRLRLWLVTLPRNESSFFGYSKRLNASPTQLQPSHPLNGSTKWMSNIRINCSASSSELRRCYTPLGRLPALGGILNTHGIPTLACCRKLGLWLHILAFWCVVEPRGLAKKFRERFHND
jgi:hypothetical protein